MGQVAFDTQEFVETLENAGLPKEQAKAISIAVRKSHEVADVATKADIVEVKYEIAGVNRNVADVRKDLSAEIAKAEARTEAHIALLRKDVEVIANNLLIKLSKVMIGIVGFASAVVALVIKLT